MIQRGEFLTSYTPYQPEITQGTLQYLFEFQTQVALLTGMEVANASMYDGSTGTRRGRADGQPRDAPPQGADLGRAASALSRIIETTAHVARASAPSSAKPDVDGLEDLIAAVDKETVLRRRAEPELLRPRAATSPSSPTPATPPARC